MNVVLRLAEAAVEFLWWWVVGFAKSFSWTLILHGSTRAHCTRTCFLLDHNRQTRVYRLVLGSTPMLIQVDMKLGLLKLLGKRNVKKKSFFVSACSDLSIYVAKTLREADSEEKLSNLGSFFQSLPRLITETLYYWVVRSGFLFIKIETDLDDQVILDDHCDFLTKLLSIILQPNMKLVEQDFTIDLRNFKNFEIRDEHRKFPEETLELLGLKVNINLMLSYWKCCIL